MGFLSTLRSRFGLTAARPVSGTAWMPLTVREANTGDWQRNLSINVSTALSNPTVFGCVTRIALDVAKIAPPLLFELDDDGIWNETTNSAYSPVLRKPNRYQTAPLFYEQWMLSKLLWGNTYILKDRDERGVVKALYILDPQRVTPLVAPDGSVYYQINPHELAGIPEGFTPGIPAREIIHDRWNCAIHPLVGLSPLYAAGGAANEANLIGDASSEFFSKGGRPSGLLVAPTEIKKEHAAELSSQWHALGPGKTAVVGLGMKYQDIGTSAVDSQLIEQLEWTEETIAKCFGMPISILNSSKQPPYANAEASQLQYKSQCLEPHFTGIAYALDEGLELPTYLGTEFDIDALIWMDTTTKTKAAHDAIAAGAMSPNEARYKYFGLGPVAGGESPYLQQQYFSLAAIAERDASDPFSKPTPAPAATSTDPTEEEVAATVGRLGEG